MPQKDSGRGKREATIMGGTAVEGSSRSTYVAVGMLIAVVAIVLILGRGGEKKGPPQEPDIAAPETTTSTTAPAVTRPAEAPGEVGFQVDEAEVKVVDNKETAAIALQEKLGQQRFWSTVSIDRSQSSRIIVSSSSCQEPAMKAVLTSAAGQLREAGLTTLRCVEKHGALVYEEAL